jgi:hypothetical protein
VKKSLLRPLAVIAMGVAALLGQTSVVSAETGCRSGFFVCVSECPGNPLLACHGWNSSCTGAWCGTGSTCSPYMTLTCYMEP